MNSSTLKIASATLGGSGILVGGGVGVYYHLNKGPEKKDETTPAKQESKGKPISEWLTEDNAVLLKSSEDDSKWGANWSQFVFDNDTNDLPNGWNISEWSSKKSDIQIVPSDFKNNCERNSKETIEQKGGDSYDKVLKYCTKTKDTT